jgi:hypothetical protein
MMGCYGAREWGTYETAKPRSRENQGARMFGRVGQSHSDAALFERPGRRHML